MSLRLFPYGSLARRGCVRYQSDMKPRIISALLVLASAVFLFAQAEQVKGKAKDLKKKVEGQQTNKVDKPTPPQK